MNSLAFRFQTIRHALELCVCLVGTDGMLLVGQHVSVKVNSNCANAFTGVQAKRQGHSEVDALE